MSIGAGSTDPRTSSGFGEQFSIGGGSQQASSSGYSQSQASQTVYPDKVWPEQAGYLTDLWGSAQAMAGNRPQGIENLYNRGAQGLSNLANPGVNPYLEAYQGQVQQNLERNLLPQVNQGAIGAGQFGGARHDIGRGLAVSDANRQIADMAAGVYNEDMNRALGALSQVPEMANLGLQVPWYGLQQYGGLLGAPTVLDQGSKSKSSSFSTNQSQSSGSTYNKSYGYEGSQSSGGGGRNFNIGI